MKTSMVILAILLLGNYLKKMLMFIVVLFTIAKKRKQPKSPSIYEWIKKIQCMCTYVYVRVHTHAHRHTHRGILLSHKKEWASLVAQW